MKRSVACALAMTTSLISSRALADGDSAKTESGWNAHFFMGTASFAGWAMRGGAEHGAAALLLAPLGGGVYYTSTGRLSHGISVFGPALNVLGFVRQDFEENASPHDYCTRGNPLCTLALGGANLDVLRLTLGSSREHGFAALTGGPSFLVTSSPSTLYTAAGFFVGLQYTPSGY